MAGHRPSHTRPISDVLGPRSQLRMRNLVPWGVEEERQPGGSSRDGRLPADSQGDIILHDEDPAPILARNATSEDTNSVDLHPYTTSLVTSMTRYVEPPALPTVASSTGHHGYPPPAEPGWNPKDFGIKPRPGFNWDE